MEFQETTLNHTHFLGGKYSKETFLKATFIQNFLKKGMNKKASNPDVVLEYTYAV